MTGAAIFSMGVISLIFCMSFFAFFLFQDSFHNKASTTINSVEKSIDNESKEIKNYINPSDQYFEEIDQMCEENPDSPRCN